MKNLVGMVLASICLATSFGPIAEAGFKNDYAAWKSMDQYARYNYIQGLVDQATNDFSLGEQAWVTARRDGTVACGLALHINADMLEGAITKHYEEFPRDWGVPPAAVLNVVMRDVCIGYINTERQKAGLDPWISVSGPISRN
ncbi:hypothetical protein [Rhizobium ruizarguesonis]|uniref:hypothetical protein n=1 Tax=Rhizobium ruizarguesonis TaxID=2081791 RepID=UPI0013C09DAB|nr:hypothetical protein [Rhizobium ruizarguesonis]NEI98553.1 hypothetical protein [Rhizobium ruizarguesonis]NEJ36112.1 hypothetical protein [Rhizobium ruizarguesonis]